MGEPVKMDNGATTPEENNNISAKNCALCGCSTPAVKCDKCGSQTFCLSCDDMYHRHPKRRFHLRKAVDSIWNTYRSPRLRKRTELPGDPSKIPVPPPRTKKRHFSSFNSGFDLPLGYKTFWQQKRLMESSQSPVPRAKASSSLSPAPSHESKSLSPDAGVLIDSPTPSKADSNADTQLLQRRSSADNSNAVLNPSMPMHVFVPGIGPMPMDMQGRSTLGFPGPLTPGGMHHSASVSDLSGVASTQQIPSSYHFSPHLTPFIPPHLNPYSPQLAHFNCPQCISASWSNLMSPNMAAYHQLHMHQHQPWPPLQSPASRSRNSPAPEALPRQEQSPMPFQAPDNSFSTPAFLYPNGGAFSPNLLKKTEASGEVPEQKLISPVGPVGSPTTRPSGSDTKIASESSTLLQQIIAGDEEMASEEEEEEEVAEDDENLAVPDKPTEEWTCVHCTYVNPPGSHICDVCCKTSYRSPREIKVKKKKKPKHSDVANAMDITDHSKAELQASCSELAAQTITMPIRQFPQKVMQL